MHSFTKIGKTRTETVEVGVENLVLGGLTGTPDSVRKHLEELEAIGVAKPSSAPIYFRLSANLVTRADTIQVVGDHTSGEAEPVLLSLPDGIWIGIGSDHTDRKAETYDIALSKQLCQKPIGPELWPLEEVAAHWERLVLRSYIRENGQRVVYQDGTLADMLHAEILLAKLPEALRPLPPNSLFMCGTTPAIGGIRPSDRFEVELHDPVLGRTLRHAYDVVRLPHTK